ncbi:hypothetical protein Tco_1350881, partial [Tanacetum coccineum]
GDVQDDDNEQTESDNDDDDFVHPKLSTFDEKERQDEEDKKEEWYDDETSDEESQGRNDEKDKIDEEEKNEDEKVNELYRDVNINMEGRDTEMADANVQATQVIEDTYVIITAFTPEVQQQSSSVSSCIISNMFNPNPDTSIDSILNLNIESTSLVDVPVSTNVEMPPSSVTPLPLPPIPFIQPQQQTPVPIPTIVPTEVLTRSTIQAKTSHVVAANLFEIELKKILIDKMENNKSIDRSIQQKTLYKALVDAYETDKDILETYGDTVTFKRHRDDEDEDGEPSAGSNRRSKRRRARKEPESTSAPKEKTSKSTGKSKEGWYKSHQMSTGKSAQAEEPIHADRDLEEPAH